MAHKSARPRVAGAQQHRTHNSCSKGFRDLEDQVQFALEVQDSLATVVMPILAKLGKEGEQRVRQGGWRGELRPSCARRFENIWSRVRNFGTSDSPMGAPGRSLDLPCVYA